MSKLTISFTAPSDIDFDRVGIAIATTSAACVTDANANDFVFIRDKLSPSSSVTIDIFELRDGTDLLPNTTYYVIANPGDADENFRTDFVSGDVVSGAATLINESPTPDAGANFEATLVSVLKADATIQANTDKDKNGNVPIKPTGLTPVGNVDKSITYEFLEGPSEDAIPAARRVLRVMYWIKDNKKVRVYNRLKAVSDVINTLVNRAAGTFQNVNVSANTGFRASGIIKTGGSAYGYDDDVNRHFWELLYDVVISEEESFATSDAGDSAWV